MNVGDQVRLTDVQGTHEGHVTSVYGEGMVSVKWSTGITEKLHESELTLAVPAEVFDAVEGRIDPQLLREEAEREEADAYPLDDPKHPTFRERLADLWDAIR